MYKISVVIPTLNRAELLAETIEGIESQSLPREQYEVIVVDNNSADRTIEVLEQKSFTYSNLRFSLQQKPGAAATRNTGLEMSSGEIVLFIDDDIESDRKLLESHLRYHGETPDASVIGTIRTNWETTRDPFLRYMRDRGIFDPYSVNCSTLDFSCYHTGNVSTPRRTLEGLGGFDERFEVYGMEDIELGYRLERSGCPMVRGVEATALHHYFPSYRQFAERCEQAGFSLGLMLKLHPELRGRFTENGRVTRLLRPFHRLYKAAEPMIHPLSRSLEKREERRGSGPISTPLGFHYDWALRYRFFLGFSHYATNGNGVRSNEPAREREDVNIKESTSKVPTSSLVR